MPTVLEKPRIRRIVKSVKESKAVTTLFFQDDQCADAKPGQFVMVWMPGFDEMPMSLSAYDRKGRASITVRPWGKASEDLARTRAGDLVGIRGPYGVAFSVEHSKALLVGSGTGLAPLLPLAQELVRAGSRVTLVMAGKSKDDLFFIRRSRRIVKTRNLFIVTGDGSSGIKGQVSDIAQDLAEKRRFNRVYVCGSEVMMRNLFELFARSGVKFEASLEREMKCAVGLCGSCSIGPYLLCRDGPVLPRETLSDVLDEFGALRRDASGKYVRELGRPVA